MRTKDGLYFAPGCTYMNLNFEDKNELINAFYSRINGFYFEPANKLNGKYESFALDTFVYAL